MCLGVVVEHALNVLHCCPQTATYPPYAGTLSLHPIQVRGSDPMAAQSTANNTDRLLTVPARTTAVFVQKRA